MSNNDITNTGTREEKAVPILITRPPSYSHSQVR